MTQMITALWPVMMHYYYYYHYYYCIVEYMMNKQTTHCIEYRGMRKSYSETVQSVEII